MMQIVAQDVVMMGPVMPLEYVKGFACQVKVYRGVLRAKIAAQVAVLIMCVRIVIINAQSRKRRRCCGQFGSSLGL